MEIEKQIKIVAESSVILSPHGSALSHVLWMKPSSSIFKSSVIEILPYNYHCRDWFHSAANVANVNYYSIMSTPTEINPNLPKEKSERISYCRNHSEKCITGLCHDYLRDQNLSVPIGVFTNIWSKIIQNLKFNQQF